MALDEVLSLLSTPSTLVLIGMQFTLGLVLGYYSAKILKHIIALISIIALGSALSIWNAGITLEDLINILKTLSEPAKKLLTVLGVFTAGPMCIGFILGVIIAIVKR